MRTLLSHSHLKIQSLEWPFQNPVIVLIVLQKLPDRHRPTQRLGGTREGKKDWVQILSLYWPITANYAIEHEPYAAENSRAKANVVLTTVSMNKIVKCLFIECKTSRSRTNLPTIEREKTEKRETGSRDK
jgi:hypothetical protein